MNEWPRDYILFFGTMFGLPAIVIAVLCSLSWAQPAGTNTASIPQLTKLTFAGLPANPVQGMIATITDGLAGNCGDAACTTFGTTVTGGGGALKLLVWYNGANWTLSGK